MKSLQSSESSGGITWCRVWVWRSNTRTPVAGERFTALMALPQMFISDVSSRIQGHPAATQVCSVWLGRTKISAWRPEKNRKKLRKCWKIRPIMAEEIALPLQLIWLMAITVDISGPVPSWIILRYSSASLQTVSRRRCQGGRGQQMAWHPAWPRSLLLFSTLFIRLILRGKKNDGGGRIDELRM